MEYDSKVLAEIKTWIDSFGLGVDTEFVDFGVDIYSPRKILQEIDQHTPLGERFYKAFVDIETLKKKGKSTSVEPFRPYDTGDEPPEEEWGPDDEIVLRPYEDHS